MNNKNNICYNKKKNYHKTRRRFTSLRSLYFQLIFSRWYNGTYILSMYILCTIIL